MRLHTLSFVPSYRKGYSCIVLSRNTSDDVLEGIKPDVHQSMDFGEESMTGHVGTALYVAPELVTTSAKAMYNQVG